MCCTHSLEQCRSKASVSPRRAVSALLLVLLLINLSSCRVESPDTLQLPDAAPPTVTLKLPAGSPHADKTLRAEAIADLETLPKPASGGKLQTAARLEPAGLKFPNGVEVIWPLATPHSAGEKLWIALLDESAGAWLDTGNTATVTASGHQAAGKVYHFSVYALGSGAPPERKEGPPKKEEPPSPAGVVNSEDLIGLNLGPDKTEEEEKPWPPNQRIKLPQWKFINVFENVVDARKVDTGADGKAVETIKKQFQAAGDGENLKALGALFAEHPFEVVEKVAKDKLLSAGEADGLARMRRQMINEAMARTIADLDPQKTLTIGMLDSGNKNSGIASDVDQTVFVIPKDKAAQLGIDEGKVIDAFNKKFKSLYGVHPERLGIESLNGADFFPDWRQAQSTSKIGTGANEIGKRAMAFAAEADRVVGEKRLNPEAYRSEGQLKSQAEGRGYESLQEHHQRVRDMAETKAKIDEVLKNTKLSASDRQAQAARYEAELLKKYGKNYPAGSLAELEQKFHKDSPWTEVGWDKDGKPVSNQLADPKNKVLANKPEFHKRFAFDGAWDNWLMYEHHPHNRRKYLLRSVAEGISLKRLLGGQPLSTFEYDKVYGEGTAESQRKLTGFLNDVYRDLPEDVRRNFKRALDVAAKERLRHKGVKNPSTGQDYTLREVWSEFWPPMTEKQRRLYQGMSKDAIEKMLHERAIANWEAVGREIMIENLVRTIDVPAKMLHASMSAEEFRRVQKKFPNATRAKLTKAVQRQLYHGIHDLMTIEHARELVASPEHKKQLPPRQTDLLDRFLQRLGGPDSELGRQVLQIATSAALKRVAAHPGDPTFRQAVWQHMHKTVSQRLASGRQRMKEVYDDANRKYANYRKGTYTQDYVARQLAIAGAERWASTKAYAAHLAGFNVKSTAILIPETGWPRVEMEFGDQKFSSKKLFRNMASAGNVDSVLMVMLAYQEGDASDAAWAAGYEIAMNVPIISKANAAKELVVHGRPQGVIMLGSAMAVPALGQAFIFINIGKTSVMLLGNYVLDPLKDDDADKLYQGFLDESSGFKNIERSQRPSLLHFVPIRVVPREIEMPDGKKALSFVWRRYEPQEADELFIIIDDEDYEDLAESGILGGGPDWEEALRGVANAISNPQGNFEAKRASMYYHFRHLIDKRLAKDNLEPHESDAYPVIRDFFLEYLDDWVHATGAFANFPENTLIARRFEDEAIRHKIADRASRDLIRSYNIIRGSALDAGTIERNIEARIEQREMEKTNRLTNAMIVAIDEAWQLDPEMDLAHAIHQELDKRKENARERAPRFHARPMIRVLEDELASQGDAVSDESSSASPKSSSASVESTTYEEEDKDEQIDFHISVIDGPEEGEKKPANANYDTAVRYETEMINDTELELTAYITVTGRQTGELIPPYAPARYENYSVTPKGELAIKLGRMASSKSLPESVDVKVAYRPAEGDATKPSPQVTPAPSTPTTSPSPASSDRSQDAIRVDRSGIYYETWNATKATARTNEWGGSPVTSLDAQLWICWEKAPLGHFYYYDMEVTGGVAKAESKYQNRYSGPAEPRDHFPDDHEPSDHFNVFVFPFDWPEGHVGNFHIKGKLYAFDRAYTGDAWRQAEPVSVFEFDEPFQIPDTRLADDIKLVSTYNQRMSLDELAGIPGLDDQSRERYAGYARDGMVNVKLVEPFKPENVDLWGLMWKGKTRKELDMGPIGHVMHVRWREVPPNLVYYYDVKVSGGVPKFEKDRSNRVTPIADFPPKFHRSGPGSNAFGIDIPWPSGHAGIFKIDGILYALPKGRYGRDQWREVEPIATMPFSKSFELNNTTRSAQGTFRTGGNYVYVNVVLSSIQRGKRVVEISGGGRTMHYMLDKSGRVPRSRPGPSGYIKMRFPYGTRVMRSLNLSFMDFGERVSMTVPLEPEPRKPTTLEGPNESLRESMAKLHPQIAKYKTMDQTDRRVIDLLYRAYNNLALWHRSHDYGQFKEYGKQASEYSAKYYRMIAAAHADPKRKAATLIQAANAKFSLLYSGAIDWGNVGDAESAFAQGVSAWRSGGIDEKDAANQLAGLHNTHANFIFQYTGDTARATELWAKANEYRQRSGSRVTRRGEPVSPYEPDRAFDSP